MEIELREGAGHQKVDKVRSADATKIDALLAVLRSAEATTDHKCPDTGQVILRQKGGGKLKLGLLAGHHAEYYEFRIYRGTRYELFRVGRTPFLKAMRDFGVGELDPGMALR